MGCNSPKSTRDTPPRGHEQAKPAVTPGRAAAWRAAKFTLFSASAGLIQIGGFALFNEALHFPYWLGYGLALILSVLWNFTFNRRYTFRSDCNVPKAMALVFLFYLVFTPLSTWGGNALAEGGVNEYVVLSGTMITNFITEFAYQRFVVYRHAIDTNDVAARARGRREAKCWDSQGKSP